MGFTCRKGIELDGHRDDYFVVDNKKVTIMYGNILVYIPVEV